MAIYEKSQKILKCDNCGNRKEFPDDVSHPSWGDWVQLDFIRNQTRHPSDDNKNDPMHFCNLFCAAEFLEHFIPREDDSNLPYKEVHKEIHQQ